MSTEISVKLPQAVPLIAEAEVVVLGGGPGGIGAAVGAARNGAKVLLIEHYGFLGGMATAGEVNPFMPNHVLNESLDQGVFSDWLERIGHYCPVRSGRVFDPIAARLAAEDLCVEAGVQLLYHHRAAHVETQDGMIQAVVLHSKSGLVAVKGKIYIDCTGDGDLAALAGAPFEMGGDTSKFVQPMTLCFKLKLNMPGNVQEISSFTRNDANAAIQDAYKVAQKEGRTSNPRENVLMFPSSDPSVLHFNTTRVIHKFSTNGVDLSAAEMEARKQARELIEILRNEVPVFKDCKIYSMATQIGIRESRRILGEKFVTRDDYVAQKKYADGIARVNYPIDIHNPNGTGTEIIHLPSGAWYEIPYGCLVPRVIDNLLVGSRCISVDHAVHSSVRVMPPVTSMGQAAGVAASIAVAEGKRPRDVDGEKVVQVLIAQGRNLTPERRNEFIETDQKEHERLERINLKRAKTFNA